MPSFSKHQLIAAYIIVAAALVGTGALLMKSQVFGGFTSREIKFIEPAGVVPTEASPEKAPAKICVHVAGRVKKPGLYELEPGSRVVDAVKAAGGELANADMESVNLAQKLSDGEQVFIAAKGSVPAPSASVVSNGKPKTPAAPGPANNGNWEPGPVKIKPGEGKINVNTAGLDDLQRLPGIGPAMAQRIIDYRKKHGNFKAVEEMDEIEGIGPSTLEKLKPFVSF